MSFRFHPGGKELTISAHLKSFPVASWRDFQGPGNKGERRSEKHLSSAELGASGLARVVGQHALPSSYYRAARSKADIFAPPSIINIWNGLFINYRQPCGFPAETLGFLNGAGRIILISCFLLHQAVFLSVPLALVSSESACSSLSG